MSTLFKYLDAKGGLSMLSKSNLQFTNAMYLNDPFDCHPALISQKFRRNNAKFGVQKILQKSSLIGFKTTGKELGFAASQKSATLF